MSTQDGTGQPTPVTMIGSNVTAGCRVGGDQCGGCYGYVDPAAEQVCYHACHDDGTGNRRDLTAARAPTP